MKILIIKLSAIGDVIHTLPALNALRRRFPEAQIDWFIERAASDLVIGHPAVDHVCISDRKQWIQKLKTSENRWKTVREIVGFVREIRKTRYDLVIDFQQLLKSGIMVMLAKGGRKAGFDKGMQHMEGSWLFLNERIPPVSMEIHALSRYLILLEALGVPTDQVEYRIPVAEADRQRIADILAAEGMDGTKPLVCINPVALWDTKLWRNDRFAQVADRLIADYGADVVFTGGPADASEIAAIQSLMRQNAVSLAGRTTLKELAALYERSAFVISTDTGPMHLSAAVGTSVIAIFGSTAPWRTGPFGPGHEIIRQSLPCSPCFKRKCLRGDHLCMENIRVSDVLERAERFIS